MNRSHILILAAVCFIGAAGLNAADAQPPAKILFFTKSTRFQHEVIKQKDGKESFCEKILDELGAKNNFKIETTKDGGAMTAENLAKYSAVIFYTSGDLTQAKSVDGSAPMTPEGKAALLTAVKNGLPFICVHNALKTFDAPTKPLDPYVEMLGGIGINHGAQQIGVNNCVDLKFPGCADLAKGIKITDEWYADRDYAPDIHVILVQDPTGMKEAIYKRPPYPATWAHMYGKGRVFVTGMGHREDVWTNPVFQTLLVGGIQWALGRAEADITPNLDKVTPGYAEMPGAGKK